MTRLLIPAFLLLTADAAGAQPILAGMKVGLAMRTFGPLFAHVAEGQFGTCASLKGAANPVQGRHLERELKTKEEFVKVLSDSFAFCDDIFSSLTDGSVQELVKMGQGEIVRGAVAFGIVAHDSEMYGIATVYLRGKNLIPPSSERQARPDR